MGIESLSTPVGTVPAAVESAETGLDVSEVVKDPIEEAKKLAAWMAVDRHVLPKHKVRLFLSRLDLLRIEY